MAQATVDLPDSPQNSADPLSNPDDLLSQLAGNEIDRLLAEADADHPPASKPVAPVEAKAEAAPPSQADEPQVAAQVGDLLDKIQDEKKTPPAPVDEQVDNTPEGKERQALLDAAGFENPKPASTESSAIAAEASERSALLKAAGFDTSQDGAEALDEQEEPEPEYAASLPFYLKPLEWINAPLDACPEAVRGILGKVAIVTLINAAAALVYVLVLRKH